MMGVGPMMYKHLTRTRLQVSALCLGTVNYGTAMPAKDAMQQLDQFTIAGGNFIDTAHVYGDWVQGARGKSERLIGDWLRSNRCRDKMVIATKGAHPRLETMERSRVTPIDIETDLNESLDFLGTDHVDLYFLHRDNPSVPVGEIFDCLEALVSSGKISYYGCSNWTLPRIQEASLYAHERERAGFVCNQLMWSLADIRFENLQDKTFVLMDEPTYIYHTTTGLSAMGYMAAAKGYFARKHHGEQIPKDISRIYNGGNNDVIYRKLCQLSEATAVPITEICLACLMCHPFVSIPIASFDNDEQLREGVESCTCGIADEELFALHTKKRYVLT
jgi:aryl-alcohol dehydrogenase-like predicted oxidoreductase